MKKSISANIAGTLFQIDEDAYNVLERYLNSIESGYGYSAEGKEIASDLEVRLSELLTNRTQSRSRMVTIEDVNWAISVLGKPEDIGATQGSTQNQSYNNTQGSYYSPPHRLYRDPDNRVIGGVCSGVGAYFDVDPVLIRVAFVILFFAGVGPIAYIIMWIVIPKAYTVTQKLEMRGIPPTPENIRRYS